MTSTHDTIEAYHQLPIAAVESNEPYSVGDKPKDAVIRDQAKNDFIEASTSWPEVNFPLLEAQGLKEAEQSLLRMLNEVVADTETDDSTKDVAFEQIAVKLAEVYRHLEVIRGLGSVAAKQELSRERAGDMTVEIFGQPDKQIFGQLLSADRTIAQSLVESDDPLTAEVARDFLLLTSEAHPDPEAESFKLTDETIETLRGDLEKLFPDLAEFLAQDIDQPVTPEESLAYFNQVLDIFGLSEKGWTSELSNGRAANTKGDIKKILIGKNRKPFTPKGIKGVSVHEGLHALRHQNASEQENPIKRRALPGNLLVEEGLATSAEQIVTGEHRVAGVPYYVSLGLQLGLDQLNGQKRNFRETHEIMWRRILLQNSSKHGMITKQDIQNAKIDAYQTTIRTTRGNSLDARDIAYFEGGRKANQWFNEISTLDEQERLEKLQWVVSGKFDPTNPIHAQLFDAAEQTN